MTTNSSTISILVIDPTGATMSATIEPTLEAFQELVGGDIEALSGDCFTAYINEDGKHLGLPRNPLGQAALEALGISLWPGDWIPGPVVFVGVPDGEGGDTSLQETVHDIIRLAMRGGTHPKGEGN